ncbi:MAG: hypothetical protein QXZ70_00515 [Candidatus Bathyarchaeia archaeon]
MTKRIVNKDDILNLLSERQKSRKRFVVTCKDRSGQALFTFRYPHNSLQVVSSSHFKTLIDTFDRCGIVDLKCEYYPFRLTSGQGVKYDSMALPNFGEWFQKTTENKQEIFIDTNMIIYRTLSRVLFNRVSDFKEIARKIRIPRLVLLELEAKYNRAKEDFSKSTENIRALETRKDSEAQRSAKQKAQRGQEQHGREVRLMISAQIEVQLLRSLGAQTVFLPLSPELLAAYYTHAGRGFTDPFIRKEILDSTGGGQPFLAVFLTRDLMNALTACAENLDTFYFSHASSDRASYKVDVKQVADVMIEAAIAFEEIRLCGLIPRKTAILKGMWETKSNVDWLTGRLLMDTW